MQHCDLELDMWKNFRWQQLHSDHIPENMQWGSGHWLLLVASGVKKVTMTSGWYGATDSVSKCLGVYIQHWQEDLFIRQCCVPQRALYHKEGDCLEQGERADSDLYLFYQLWHKKDTLRKIVPVKVMWIHKETGSMYIEVWLCRRIKMNTTAGYAIMSNRGWVLWGEPMSIQMIAQVMGAGGNVRRP